MGQNWTVPAGTYRYIAMDTYFEERSQSIDSNSTVLYWAIRGWDTSGSDAYWFSYAVNVGSLVINGNTVFNRTGNEEVLISIGTDTSATKKKIIASGTITIPHNSDGSKDCNTSFSLHPRWNQATYDWKNTKTLSLTDIPRASTFTISDTTVNFGDKVDFTITRAVSTFTHKLKYSIGSASGTIASNVATSASWTIPNDLMKQVTSATNGKITITCETYSGSELIGSKTATIAASVPSSVVPSLTVTVAEAATIPSALSGMYIQGRSKLKVTSSGTGQYGAKIKSYTVTVEGKNYSGSSVTTSTLSTSGTLAVKVVATDSRGRTTTKTTNITVYAYSLPKITGVMAYRCASSTDSTSDTDGAYICVKPFGSVTALNSKNAKSCVVYYKQASASTYSSKTLTMSDYTLDSEYVIVSADVSSSYDVYVYLKDSFSDSGTKYIAPQVMAASAYIHIPAERDGMGLGKRLEGKGLEVGWTAKFYKAVTFLGDIIGKMRQLANLFDSRPTSANIEADGSGGISTFKATTSMTEGAPPSNAHIIHHYWDNTSGYDAQLAQSNSSNAKLYIRGQSAGVWGNWKTLADTDSVATTKQWTAVTTVGAWSRICSFSGGYQNLLLSVRMVQTAQVTVCTYIIGIGYNSATINQIGASGYTSNYNLQLRVTFASATSGYIELYNDYGVNSATIVSPGCQITTLTKGATFPTLYTSYTAVDDTTTVKATYASRANGFGTSDGISSVKSIEAEGSLQTHTGAEIFGKTPYVDFHYAESTADYTARIIESSKGTLTAISSITSGSDKRLKKAIRDIPEKYLLLVEKLYPKLYRFRKTDNYLHAGFIAQDVLKAERELGITKSILVRGTGKMIQNPKNPDEMMLDYFSIDYQAYSVLQGAYFMKKIADLEQKIIDIENSNKS